MKPDRCDARPRIYIRPTAAGVRWGSHPNSLGREALTPGHAVDAALDALGHVDLVVIVERRG